ncbi:unnamed protein product, partial [Dovyalis caffra]
ANNEPICIKGGGGDLIDGGDFGYDSLPQILELSIPPDEDDVWNRSTVGSRPTLISPEKIRLPKTKLGFWAGSANSDVGKYFKWHSPPVKYDEFHMVMHELWKRRHIISPIEAEK